MTQVKEASTGTPPGLQLAVIIPTFNEAENIVPLIERLTKTLHGITWEAVFVDDDSPDGTAQIVRDIARTHRNIRIVHRVGRRGLSSAAIEGMLATAAPVLAVIDGDMQHDEALLPTLYAAIAERKADIAIGSRYTEGGSVDGWDKRRVMLSRLATRLGRFATPAKLSDPLSGYFALSRESLMQAVPHLSAIGFKLLLDIIASMPRSPKIVEFGYHFRPRIAGQSKVDATILAEYAALLTDKMTGGVLPPRFLNFLLVGGTGVVVHLGVLRGALAFNISFLMAEVAAVFTAMTTNFLLNNAFTYRDKRLRAWGAVRGLLSFYAICAIGAVANVGIGTWMNTQQDRWWIAGLAGAMVGAVWNFTATSFFTWRK